MRTWLCLLAPLDAPGPAEAAWITTAQQLLGAEGILLVPSGPAAHAHTTRYRRCAAFAATLPLPAEVVRAPSAQRQEPPIPDILRDLSAVRGVRLVPLVPPGRFRALAGAARTHGAVLFTAPGEELTGIRRFIAASPRPILLVEDAPAVPPPALPPTPPPLALSAAEVAEVWAGLGLPTIARADLRADPVRAKLGRGNAAWVSGKVHPTLGPVAVKTCRIGPDGGKEGSFLRESWALARLVGAPGVVRCLGGYVDIEDQRAALVLERGTGTLRSADPAALAMVARGLAAMHVAGLTHRDVRAENVLWLPDGRACLLDLGVAWPTGAWDPGPPPVGAPQRQAPEVIVDVRAFEPASDVFSLGTMLYGLLVGHEPWAEVPLPQRIARIEAGELPPVPPGPLGEVVAACWARWPEERPEAAAVAARLEALAGVG